MDEKEGWMIDFISPIFQQSNFPHSLKYNLM
jgi:hypothetical protein